MSYFVGILNRIRNIFVVGVMGQVMGCGGWVGRSRHELWVWWFALLWVCLFCISEERDEEEEREKDEEE